MGLEQEFFLVDEDGGHPATVLEIAALVNGVAQRVREEDLTVTPVGGLTTFEVEDRNLLVPGFEELSVDLFREAVTLGVDSVELAFYLDSLFEFAGASARAGDFEGLRPGGKYRCPETRILENFGVEVSRESGLRLVREACDELEEQVHSLRKHEKSASVKPGDREG